MSLVGKSRAFESDYSSSGETGSGEGCQNLAWDYLEREEKHFSVLESLEFIHILSEEVRNVISLQLIAFYGRDYHTDACRYGNLRSLEGIFIILSVYYIQTSYEMENILPLQFGILL